MANRNRQLKTVVITGGGSGIGFESAKKLLQGSGETQQFRVVLLGRDRVKLEEAAKTLGGQSDSVGIASCDLRDSKAIKATVEKIASTYQGIYGLVNNAGVYPFGGTETTTEESWDACFDVNLKGPFLLTQAVTAVMAKGGNGGRIVNVSSTAGLLPNHFALAYSVSKAAMIHMTKTMAKELGKDGITVNCVCPGIVKTPLHEAYHSSRSELEEFYQKRGAAMPLGRVGEPEDVAGAIRFLLSDEAAWITGDVLVVDGGRLLL
jgi:NAD(P)-dependent dehydrogenase (short-subunit alcohol dehydrogenase family)